MSAATDAIPRDRQGFRLRGRGLSRVDAFVDAAFAFAVTLLVVLVGRVPNSVPELLDAMRSIPAFGFSFLLMMRIWLTHRAWSARYGLDDPTSVRLSLSLVFVMLVYVYPLRLLSNTTTAWMSGGLFGERIDIHTVDELRAMYIIFGAGFIAVAAVLVGLHAHALRQSAALDLDRDELLLTRQILWRWVGSGFVALVSMALAACMPMSDGRAITVGFPGFIYLSIILLRPLSRRWVVAPSAAGAAGDS